MTASTEQARHCGLLVTCKFQFIDPISPQTPWAHDHKKCSWVQGCFWCILLLKGIAPALLSRSLWGAGDRETLLVKADSSAGDLSASESSLDSGKIVPTWINLALSSELLSFLDVYDSGKGHMCLMGRGTFTDCWLLTPVIQPTLKLVLYLLFGSLTQKRSSTLYLKTSKCQKRVCQAKNKILNYE